MHNLQGSQELFIKQRKELAELIGFESRNKYEIRDQAQNVIGFAAEQSKGFLGFITRQFFGHWRTFEIHLFDASKVQMATALHPFRWIFQRLEIRTKDQKYIGALQQRFTIFSKKFDLEDERGNVFLTVNSPFWKIWTFPFMNNRGQEIALIEKKWTGLLKEAFLDADNFRVVFNDSTLSEDQRLLLLSSAFLIDLQYFERKANQK